MFSVLELKVALNTSKNKDHGISLTQTGFLRYSLKFEYCKNLKKCKGGMTFVEVSNETTELVCFEKLLSRFENIAKFTISLQYILLTC